MLAGRNGWGDTWSSCITVKWWEESLKGMETGTDGVGELMLVLSPFPFYVHHSRHFRELHLPPSSPFTYDDD